MQKVIIFFIFIFIISEHYIFGAHLSDERTDHTASYKTSCTFYYDSYHSKPKTIEQDNVSYHGVLQLSNALSDHHTALAEKILLEKDEIQESRKFGLTFCTGLGFICITVMMLQRNKNHDREIF